MFLSSRYSRRWAVPLTAVTTVLALAAGPVGPADAATTLDHELNVAATAAAHSRYGAVVADSVWIGGSRTLVGANHAALTAYGIPDAEHLPGALAAQIEALAVWVTQVTGYDPRLPGDRDKLNQGLRSLESTLDTQRNPNNWAETRLAMDSLQYQQVDRVNGHDELRRRLLVDCSRCVRIIVLSAAGGAATGTLAIAFNTHNPGAIAAGAVGAAIALVVGVVNAYFDANALANVRNDAADVQRTLYAQITAIHHAITVLRGQVSDIEAQHALDLAQVAVARGTTLAGRISWLIRGHN